MIVAHTIAELRRTLRSARSTGQTVGFVPTMGYLHEGHASLVDKARRENDVVVASIFVNPTQFGPNEDFANYPRDFDHDSLLLEQHGCDVVFAPSVTEMYPTPAVTVVEIPEYSQRLCGQSRPTHFRGVTTVVSKLLHIVQPDRVYFGQKDGQQVILVRRMVNDLNIPVDIVVVPTVREGDGLARSSRNVYLSAEERPHATVLYRALTAAKAELVAGERSGTKITKTMRDLVASEPMVRLDYAEAVSAVTLEPPETLDGPIMLAVAAYVGRARLIDNFQLLVQGHTVSDIW